MKQNSSESLNLKGSRSLFSVRIKRGRTQALLVVSCDGFTFWFKFILLSAYSLIQYIYKIFHKPISKIIDLMVIMYTDWTFFCLLWFAIIFLLFVVLGQSTNFRKLSTSYPDLSHNALFVINRQFIFHQIQRIVIFTFLHKQLFMSFPEKIYKISSTLRRSYACINILKNLSDLFSYRDVFGMSRSHRLLEVGHATSLAIVM